MDTVISARVSEQLARRIRKKVRQDGYKSKGALVKVALERFLTDTTTSHGRLIAEIAATAVVLNHPEVEDIVLFGSVARGEDSKESDADILILVRDSDPWKATRRIVDTIYPIEVGSGVALTPVVIKKEIFFQMAKRHSPLALSVSKEGVQLFGGVLGELRRILGKSSRGY